MPKSQTSKKDKPLVTIGLLAYNRGRIVSKAIESLLAQTYTRFELIISDDASSDETAVVCQSYVKKDGKIRFFKQRSNIGLVNNSNFVLDKAKGRYFMWASDDDLWNRRYVEKLVTLLETDKKSVLAMSNYRLFKGRTYRFDTHLDYQTINEGFYLIKKYLLKPSLLVWGIFRTEMLKKMGGFHHDGRPLYGGSDNITVFKVLLKGKLMFNHEVLFYKRDSGMATSPYEDLKKIHFSKDTYKRIRRYLMFPIMFSYDLFYMLKYISTSRFTFVEKIQLTFFTLLYYVRVQVEILARSAKGVFILLRSMFFLFLSPRKSK
ncbi:MAG: glycosyltransferase family 2 protein [bacterium]|nr:glycosyltransferase family 2 protein [bacterium]